MAYRHPSASSMNRPRSTNYDDDHHHHHPHHHHLHSHSHDHDHFHHSNGHEHRQSRYSSTPTLNNNNYSSGGGSSSSSHSSGYGRHPSAGSSGYGRSSTGPGSTQRPSSFSSGYGSGYTTPGYMSPVLSPNTPSSYAQSPPPTPRSPRSPRLSPAPSRESIALAPSNPAAVKLFDVNPNPHEQAEYERSIEYHQAQDTFPCGHVLCHQCLRRFMKTMCGPSGARCPVCHMRVSGEDVSLASMGLPSENQGEQEQEAPISLLSNFDEIVKKFNGIQQSLRRLKDESVQSRSMGMTYTNTVCHLCHQAHPTLRVIQEQNQLEVRHERPPAWRNNHYFYRLQHGKVVTTFYSKVNAATICVPCTYRELSQSRAILPPDLQDALPDMDPTHNQQLALAEVGKIMAKNTAPLMALQGKNVIEVDHKIRVRERADNFQFTDTTDQIERMVRQQEENLLQHATKQIRDTGQLYHVQESNQIEVDNDETIV